MIDELYELEEAASEVKSLEKLRGIVIKSVSRGTLNE